MINHFRYYLFINKGTKRRISKRTNSNTITNEKTELNVNKTEKLQITNSISINLNTRDESKIERAENIIIPASNEKDTDKEIKNTENINKNTYRSTNNNNLETETKGSEIKTNISRDIYKL